MIMAIRNRTLHLLLSIVMFGISFSAAQSITTTAAPDENTKCLRKLDLLFVLDGSNSIGQGDFDGMLQTVASALSTINLGPDESRVGVVLYSTDVDTAHIIPLQDNKTALVSALLALPYPDEGTATDKGIDEARHIFQQIPPRNDTPRAIMLITDGRADDPSKTLRSVQVAESRGINIWAVGVGPEVNVQELETLVNNRTFFIDSYKDLPKHLQRVTKEVCVTVVLPPELCPPSSPGSPVAYVPYPGDCTRVIQCYYNPNVNRVLAVTRQCPSGQFWNNATQACADSWTVDCPYDNCQKTCDSDDEFVEQNGLLTYPMVGSSCGAYWGCKNQTSAPMCCPDHHAYNPETGCELSVGCLCEKDNEREAKRCNDGRSLCNKLPNWPSTSSYQISTSLNPAFDMPCLYGGGFVVHECDCVDSGYDKNSGCAPYINEPVSSCIPTDAPLVLSASGKKTPDTVAYSFSIDAYKADTSIWIVDKCNGKNRVHIWQDGNRTIADVYTKDGLRETLTVFVNRVTADPAEVTFQYSAGMFTLSVSQGNKQHVAMEEASHKFCLDCERKVTIDAPRNACAVTQIQAYDCRLNLNLAYGL